MKTPVIDACAIEKTYQKETAAIPVLRGIDLRLFQGQFLAVMGSSGSGKSTLLNIIGCLDRPTAGTYRLDGVDVLQSSDDQLSRLRAHRLGFVFQTFNLIPNLNVSENVELPFLYRSDDPEEVSHRVHRAIAQVGLNDRINHRPAELSGGEMQRVAMCRAVINNPKIIFADEPTGNLDSENGQAVLELLLEFQRERRTTLVLITHSLDIADMADRVIVLKDGRIT